MVVHFRDPGKAADMPKLDDRRSSGLWLQTSTTLALPQEFAGVDPPGGAQRRRCIRRNAGFQDIVDNEAAQAAGGPAPSSSSGPAPVAGGPAPEDVNMGAGSAAQRTISAVRTLETEEDASAKKRQRLMTGLPILHETDVDVNVDTQDGRVGGDARRSRTMDSAGH